MQRRSICPWTRRALGRAVLAVMLLWLAPPERSDVESVFAQSDVERVLDSLTPAQRVGQIAVLTFEGSEVVDGAAIATLIDEAGVGGVLLSSTRDNFVDGPQAPTQIAQLTNALQARVASTPGHYVPLLIALGDRGEPTAVNPLRGGMTPLPSPMALGATWEPDHAQRVGELVGRELAAVGVNLVFAPGLDVIWSTPKIGSGDLGVAAFGGSPSWVARFGRKFIEGVHEGAAGRVAVVPSSFPGVGVVDRSPTDEVAVVERALNELTATDLVPFLSVADTSLDSGARADAILTSHVRFRAIQQQADRPFSLDSGGLRYLSAQLGPLAAWRADGGVVVSPGLGLPAVRRYVDPDLVDFNERRVADEALAAGNDLLMLTDLGAPDGSYGSTERAQDVLAWLTERYGEDENVRDAVDQAARRVLTLKRHVYGGFPREVVTVDESGAAAATGLGRDLVSSVARDALTDLTPVGAQEPGAGTVSPRPGDRIVFVVDAREIRQCADCEPALEPDPERLLAIVRRNYGAQGTGRVLRGDDVGAITFSELVDWLQNRGYVPVEDRPPIATPPIATPPLQERRDLVDDALRNADWIVAMMRDVRPAVVPDSNAFKLLLAAAPPELHDGRLVAIALGAPYYLDTTEIAKLTAYYALYAHTDPFVDVAVRALFGDVPAVGASPVSVPGAGYDLAERLEPDPSQSVSLDLVGMSDDAALRIGDEFTVRTSVILDGNGRPAPDGTKVTLQRFDRTEGAFLPDVTALSRDGMASATMRAEREGDLAITAAFDNGLRSEPLAIVVESPSGAAGALPLPDVVLPPALVLSRIPVDWGIFLFSLTLILLVGVVFYGLDADTRSTSNQMRLFLLSLAWGLAGYLLVAAGGLQLDVLPAPFRFWPDGWNPAYQAAVLSVALAVVPIVPTLARVFRGSRFVRWARRLERSRG